MNPIRKLIIILILISSIGYSQIGLGTNTPEISAALDISSTSKGLLPPRMSYSQRESILAPAQGLIVYCINCGERGQLQIFDGLNWTDMLGNAAVLMKPTITPILGTYVTDGVSPRGPDTATNSGTSTSYSFIYVGTGSTSYGPSNNQPYLGGTYAVYITVYQHGIYCNSTQDFAFNVMGYNVGDAALGGHIAKLLNSEDSGYDPNVQHGLVSSGDLGQYPWYNGSYVNVNNLSNMYGEGLNNTNKIVVAQGNGLYAAKVCRNYNGGGYTDWFLPSGWEIDYTKNYGAGSLSWTSYQTSLNNAISAWVSPYTTLIVEDKASVRHVTALRYF